MPGGRPTISSSNGKMSFAIGNQTQFDYGTYFQNPSPTTQFPHLNYGVNLRRERIFFVAKYDDFTLNVTPDFGGSPDASRRASRSPTFAFSALIWSNILGVVRMVAFSGFRSIAMINLIGV
jgi:hypothetical protein